MGTSSESSEADLQLATTPKKTFSLSNKYMYLFLGLLCAASAGTVGFILVAPAGTKVPQNNLTSQINVPQTPTPTPELLTPTPSPSPTPEQDPTKNWNTYNNPAYGYSIKYPLNWTALNLGTQETNIPSYVVFNPNTATISARSITISVSNRSYGDQIAINGNGGNPITIDDISGTAQNLQDSDGNQSTIVTLPRSKNLLVLYTMSDFATIFTEMLATLQTTQ